MKGLAYLFIVSTIMAKNIGTPAVLSNNCFAIKLLQFQMFR